MGQNIQKMEKILELMFSYPNKSFKVREISKSTKIPKSTVQRYISALRKSDIINKNNQLITSNYTKFLKSFHIIKKLFNSGLIDYIEKKLIPATIIIFGSARKGEYVKESDIDLFIETTKKTNLDLSKFEKRIRYKLHLVIEPNINKLPRELFNNIINGIRLTGYLRIK